MSNHSWAASGGSGSGYHAKVVIDDAGNYTVKAGAGGTSYGLKKGASGTGGTGGESSLTRQADSKVLIKAGGGGGGNVGPNYANAGAAGTLSKSIPENTVYISTNGTKGNADSGDKATTANGIAGPISGKNWGASGTSHGGFAGGGAISASYHGYFYIKYLGPEPTMYTYTINADPAGSTIKLTATGYTQSGNHITVHKGTKISWTVSKTGYSSQSGSLTLNGNRTDTITLTPYFEYEYTTSGSRSISIPYNCVARVDMVGGGSGGWAFLNTSLGTKIMYRSSGASGAYIGGNMTLTAGTYTVNVGAGGAKSYGNASGSSGAGGNTTFNGQTAGGGKASSRGSAGAGGTATTTLSGLTKKNGNAGTVWNGNSGTQAGGASVYNSKGKGGNASSSSGDTTAGGVGYFKIYLVSKS